MASTNTKTSLDAMFKYKVAADVNKLIPTCAIIQNLVPKLSAAEKTGRKFLWPVALTYENGVTYGDDTAFSYEADIAGVYGEIQIDSVPVVLKSRVALSAANRMANGKEATFITAMSLRAGNMKESLMKRAEIECLYGKTGLGAISAVSDSSGTNTVTLTDATWAPGIFGGMEGSLLEVRNTSGTKINTNADLVLASVNIDNKTITVTGNSTDTAALAATELFYFKGAYANSMNGIDKQLTNTGSLFNIDASAYALWKATSFAVSGRLTLSKVLQGVAKAVGKGGLSEEAVLIVSALTYEGLNSDLAALRQLDSSYDSKEGETGVESLVYYAQSGKLKVMAHPFVKEGEAFLLPIKAMKRVGATEISFGFGDGDYFEKLEGSAGYQLLAQYDWCLLIEKPAKCVKFTGITNT